MSHERRVGVRFESRARGALRGPRAALHRVAGRAPAARPCVRLIAIGEAVWPCVRLIAIGEAVLDSHVLDDSCVPYPCAAGSAGYCNGRSLPANPANPKPISEVTPSGSAWTSELRGIAATRPRYSLSTATRAKRETEPGNAALPPATAGRSRARARGWRSPHALSVRRDSGEQGPAPPPRGRV